MRNIKLIYITNCLQYVSAISTEDYISIALLWFCLLRPMPKFEGIIFLAGKSVLGHSVAYFAHFLLLRDIWIELRELP